MFSTIRTGLPGGGRSDAAQLDEASVGKVDELDEGVPGSSVVVRLTGGALSWVVVLLVCSGKPSELPPELPHAVRRSSPRKSSRVCIDIALFLSVGTRLPSKGKMGRRVPKVVS